MINRDANVAACARQRLRVRSSIHEPHSLHLGKLRPVELLEGGTRRCRTRSHLLTATLLLLSVVDLLWSIVDLFILAIAGCHIIFKAYCWRSRVRRRTECKALTTAFLRSEPFAFAAVSCTRVDTVTASVVRIISIRRTRFLDRFGSFLVMVTQLLSRF